MKSIYFDNAATTFPKPPCVAEAVTNYMTENGMNISRSSYRASYDAGAMVLETRELLCRLFEYDDPSQVCFTKNITEAVNLLLKGFLKKGDHVLVSSLEHNAVMRTLESLVPFGISYTKIPCSPAGFVNPNDLEGLIRPNTALVMMLHASNVSGTVLPLEEIGAICEKHNLPLFVDTAQSAGHLPISMKKCHIKALAFTGHKGLYGPAGIGGFILSKELNNRIAPLIYGGTGSISHTLDMPSFMPDRFEAGTLNLPGIAGLNAALKWLENTSVDAIHEHELMLTNLFLSGVAEMDPAGSYIQVYGSKEVTDKNRTGVVSIDLLQEDPAMVAYRLEKKYQILTRVGLHCAPAAHEALGSFPRGTIRFSFGYFNTAEEVQTALSALREFLP